MPTLDKGFEVFANYQTILMALGIYIFTYVVRAIVQYSWKGWKTSRFYTELVLHIFPILVGGVIGWSAKKFPWPMPIAESASARIMYGAVLGMFCGLVYNRVRAWFQLQTGKPLPVSAVEEPPAEVDTEADLPEIKPDVAPLVEPKAEVKAEVKTEAGAVTVDVAVKPEPKV
jgi:hypothetical protein